METVLRLAYLMAQSIQELLGKELIALYLHGSAATSDFIPGQSDLDLVAVVQTLVSASEKVQLQAWFVRQFLPPELAGIDFELLTQQAAAFPSQQPDWNMIIRVQRHQHSIAVLTPDVSDGYSLLDLAMTRERGYALVGPDPIDAALAVRRGEIEKALKNDEVKAFCQYVSRGLEDAIIQKS